jgi:hypothetical protein
MYDIQWGVVSPEAVPIMWGRDAIPGDVGDAVMSGTPRSIRGLTATKAFRLAELTDEHSITELVTELTADMHAVEHRLREFQTRRDLREYLLQNRDRKDHRDFVIPMNLPLKLIVAAILAVIDCDPELDNLISETEVAMIPYQGGISAQRMQRLRAAADLCRRDRSN